MRGPRGFGRRGAALLAAALVLAPARPTPAQQLEPGTRVRVTAPIASRNSRFVGTVAAADSARITLRLDPAVRQAVAGDSVVIPRALIRRVEVSLGRSVARRSHAAATGAVAGALVGLLGAVLFALVVPAAPQLFGGATAMEALLSGLATSPLAGVLFGSAAAWYRRFLYLASPARQLDGRPRPQRGKPARGARPR